MVKHLNPRPVVYDFCKHYFAHYSTIADDALDPGISKSWLAFIFIVQCGYFCLSWKQISTTCVVFQYWKMIWNANIFSCFKKKKKKNSITSLDSLPPGRCGHDIKSVIFKLIKGRYRGYFLKLDSAGCHKPPLMINQHWFRWWLGAIRQQAITWAIVDQDLWHHMPQ